MSLVLTPVSYLAHPEAIQANLARDILKQGVRV